MSVAEKRALEKCRDVLVRKIQITPGFLRYFVQFDLLDDATKDKILNIQTPTQQVEYFLHSVVAKKVNALQVLIQRLKVERRTIVLAQTVEHAYEQAKNEMKFKAHAKELRTLMKLFEELNELYLLVFGTRPWSAESQTLDYHLKRCRTAVKAMKRNKELLEEKFESADSYQVLTRKLLEEKTEHEKWYRQLMTTEREIVDLRTEYRRHNQGLQDKVRKREDELTKLRAENEKLKAQVRILAKYTYRSELLVDLNV